MSSEDEWKIKNYNNIVYYNICSAFTKKFDIFQIINYIMYNVSWK